MPQNLPAPTPLWQPPPQLLNQSTLKQYIDWLFVKKGLYFRNYDDLWDWSVTDLEHFWESISQYFDVQFTTPYHYVIQQPDNGSLPGTNWFGGATLNYAEHVFRQQTSARPALLFASEQRPLREMSWTELTRQVAAVSAFLRLQGVGVGDRVVAVLPNSPEALVAFLATSAVGAVWSVCSPDSGTVSLIDRFQPLTPRVLITVDGYTYNGRAVDKTDALHELRLALPTLTASVRLAYLNPPEAGSAFRQPGRNGAGREELVSGQAPAISWEDVLETNAPDGLVFTPVPFAHPIWVLHSTNTAGKSEAVTHSGGGCLLEHLKLLALHQDVRPGDRYFWYSTAGGLMWNVAVSSLLVGATLVLYDGAPAYPALTQLWELADRAQLNHFGAAAAYLLTCMRSGMKPATAYRLTALRTIGTSTPLPARSFRWMYEAVANVWPIAFHGGTEVCSGVAGGNPLLPVYAGEVQGRLLGCKVDVLTEGGQPVREQAGELVVLKPMPSMPVQLRNDSDPTPYHRREAKRGIKEWRPGDWIRITDRNTIVVEGRAETTLNRDGTRIGTAEVYRAMESVPDVTDSLVVGVERPGGRYFVPLFVVLRHGVRLDEDLTTAIKDVLRGCSPRHVPDEIIQVEQLPYTLDGSKLETVVRKLLSGTDASLLVSRDALRDPVALDTFVQLAGELTNRW